MKPHRKKRRKALKMTAAERLEIKRFLNRQRQRRWRMKNRELARKRTRDSMRALRARRTKEFLDKYR